MVHTVKKSDRFINEMAIMRSQFKDYDEIEPYDNEYIKVKKDGLYNLTDKDGKLISDIWFDTLERNSGGGFDVSFKGGDGKTHSGQYMDTAELRHNVEIRSLVKHTDILDHIDYSDIILVEPYTLKRPGMKRGVTIIANVTYMGDSLLLGKDGKLYTKLGELYTGVQFAISQVDIKRLNKVMDEICLKLNHAVDVSNKSKGKLQETLESLYGAGLYALAFGFNTNNTDVTWVFDTSQYPTIERTDVEPWGSKGINSIKVRFIRYYNNGRVIGIENEDMIESYGFKDEKIYALKEYASTELDFMFKELEEIKGKLNRVK